MLSTAHAYLIRVSRVGVREVGGPPIPASTHCSNRWWGSPNPTRVDPFDLSSRCGTYKYCDNNLPQHACGKELFSLHGVHIQPPCQDLPVLHVMCNESDRDTTHPNSMAFHACGKKLVPLYTYVFHTHLPCQETHARVPHVASKQNDNHSRSLTLHGCGKQLFPLHANCRRSGMWSKWEL